MSKAGLEPATTGLKGKFVIAGRIFEMNHPVLN
jgi:hypothetical protein